MQIFPPIIPGSDPFRGIPVKKPSVRGMAPVFTGPLHAVDMVRFAGKDESVEARVRKEADRLREQDHGVLLYNAVWGLPRQFLRSLTGPTPFLLSINDLKGWYRAFRDRDHSYMPRALYNVTGDPTHLTPYLPYRRVFTKAGDAEALARYDALIRQVEAKVQFYEGDMAAFNQRVNALVFTEDFKKALEAFQARRGKDVDPFNDPELTDMQLEHFSRVKEDDLAQAFEQLKPVSDKATRYCLAANLVELLFKHPEYLDQVLNQPPFKGEKHPLRVVIGNNAPVTLAAAFQNVTNIMYVNRPNMWLSPYGSSSFQHEFIHAFSVQDGKVRGDLPVMTPYQKERLVQAREQMKKKYRDEDDTFLGRLRFVFTGKTATGLPNYTFFNDMEFLTNTLDMFKMNPWQLASTPAGKTVYGVYYELFGIDPGQDYATLREEAAQPQGDAQVTRIKVHPAKNQPGTRKVKVRASA